MRTVFVAGVAFAGLLAGAAIAADMPHAHQPGMMHGGVPEARTAGPTEPGQGAFAAIAEITEMLLRDPATDWASVDIEALRQHLIDMDDVTMRAAVNAAPIAGGMTFDATSADARVIAAIRRMVLAHAAATDGAEGLRFAAEEIPGGARLAVTGPRPDMIRGLGFIGVMSIGMHHQAHHLAMARGAKMSAH